MNSTVIKKPEVSAGIEDGNTLKEGTKVNPSLWNKINQIDFSMICTKLCHEKGEGWSESQAQKAILKYKQWLYLHLEDPDERFVPSETIDEVWHYHILDTRAYHKDCELVFGRFVHHFPYFGLRGEEDMNNLKKSYLKTLSRFRDVWGEEMSPDISSMCGDCDSGSMCVMHG